MATIDDRAMQALDTYNRLMDFDFVDVAWSSDEQKLDAFITHELDFAYGEIKREELVELLALGFALTGDGYKLRYTPRNAGWEFVRLPSRAIAHRIVTAGHIQYVVKTS